MRAAKVGNLQQGVTCEDKHFIPKPAAFLNEVHPPRDQLPPISTCVRRFDMVDDLTHDLFEQHARPQVHLKLELHVQKVGPIKASQRWWAPCSTHRLLQGLCARVYPLGARDGAL